MTKPNIAQAFNHIIELQNKCDTAFAAFNEILDSHKEFSQALRNHLQPSDLIGKQYVINRPHKWGNLKSLQARELEAKDRNFFNEDKGVLKLLPYYKHLECYDDMGIENFIGQFQEFSTLKETNPEFFKENSQYLVLWAEDLDFDVDEDTIFNSPHLIYEYAIFRI